MILDAVHTATSKCCLETSSFNVDRLCFVKPAEQQRGIAGRGSEKKRRGSDIFISRKLSSGRQRNVCDPKSL